MYMFMRIETPKVFDPLRARVVIGIRLRSVTFGFTSHFTMHTGHDQKSEHYIQYVRKEMLRQYAAVACSKDDVLKLTRI